MQLKVTSALLTLLVAANALPYDHEWQYDYYWNPLSAGRVVRTQDATVDRSPCVAVTESRNGVDYSVRVCRADQEG